VNSKSVTERTELAPPPRIQKTIKKLFVCIDSNRDQKTRQYREFT